MAGSDAEEAGEEAPTNGQGQGHIVQYVQSGIHLHIDPFIIPKDKLNIGPAWQEWIDDFEEEAHLQKVTNVDDWVRCLRRYAGKEVRALAKHLPNPPALTDNEGNEVAESDYQKLKRKLNLHFVPKKNMQHARYVFSKERRHPEETIGSYAARLREKSEHCEFGTSQEERILEHIIQTIEDEELIKSTIHKKWNLDTFLVRAAEKEDIKREIKDMKQMKEDHKVAKVGRRAGPKKQGHQRQFFKEENKQANGTASEPCGYCGNADAHAHRRECPAFGRRCRKCKRYNHFASCCRTEEKPEPRDHVRSKASANLQKPGRSGHSEKKKKSVKAVLGELSDCSGSESDDSSYFVKHVVKNAKTTSSAGLVKLHINEVQAMCEPDSGASANVMDEYQFRALQKRDPRLNLDTSSDRLETIQGSLTVKGQFHATLRNENRGIMSKFVVIKGHMHSPPLIGRNSLEDLGMLLIDPKGKLRGENDLRIKSITQPSLTSTLEEFDGVFQGIGCIKDPKTGKPIEVRLEMDPDIRPVAQKARHVPYYLKGPLVKWLKQGEEEGIFEKVAPGEPITWCSPLVVQPKPKYSETEELEPHMIRASIDMRLANTAMKRSRCVEAPILDDFTYHMHDCRIFSKLDLKHGYHQLAIDTETSAIGTFSTPWGNYRPKRLMFGAKSSQDVFDEMMQKIFGDIQHCMIQRDDLLLGGQNEAEHLEVVRTVLKRAQEFNVKFNKEKCQFGKDRIEFFGHIFTKDGLEADPDKIRAIVECSAPQSKEEVRSLLGMAGYLSTFIEGYASMTAPLRKLTHKDTRFTWGKEEKQAFQKIKEAMASTKTMTYFDPDKQIVLRTEASFNEGLSAGLFQKTQKGLQPVYFISRSLKDAEKRYSQTEKDALAIRWALGRLRIYLTGAPKFKIITAHKPLLAMLQKPTAKLPPRIEKWTMEMQDLDFEIEYHPGKDEADPLDYLSRHPLPETGSDGTEKTVKFLTRSEASVTLEKIREETTKDPILQEVRKCIQSGKWQTQKKGELAPYYDVRDELCIIDEMIYRLRQIVIPESLQKKIVTTGHKLGHLGSTKTKQMLRQRYWFPRMTQLIEQTVNQCFECKVTTKQSKEEPIKPTEIPEKAWDTVAVDFGGAYPDGHYNLVMVDKRTRYPVVISTPSTNFVTTREKMKEVFATYGTPRIIESDNGPPFNSENFTEFGEEEGFHHHRITPLHPRANGQAEQFMRMVNKCERIAELQGKNTSEKKTAMQEMLTAYRATPHPATGVAPYEAMKFREVRTKLDYREPDEQRDAVEEKIDKNDAEYKRKMKNKENRRFRETTLLLGDYVLVTQTKKNKWTTPYEPTFYNVVKINGSQITARRVTDGRIICRDASQFKLCNSVINTADDKQEENAEKRPKPNILERMASEVPRPPTTVAEADVPRQVPQPEVPRRETNDTSGETRESTMTAECPVPPQVDDGRRAPHRPRREKKRPAYLKDYVCVIKRSDQI